MIASLPRRLSSLGLLAAALVFTVGTAAATTFENIYTFVPLTDGNVAYAPLVQGADGLLYGVNSTGGRGNYGTIFRVTTNGNTFRTLNIFNNTDKGATPKGGIVQARDGNFYGTTFEGGNSGVGSLFQCDLNDDGHINILAQFNNGKTPGANPVGALVEGTDGFLYGTARLGGLNNYGTIFRSDLTAGTLGTLYTITGGLGGYYPSSDLIQATDGNFYGTTEIGGTSNLGTFFKLTPDGVYTVLYSFTGGADGGKPQRGVIQGFDGAFYGVCNIGGQYAGGTIYRIDYLNASSFLLTALHAFIPALLDGSDARGQLVQASNGNLYGTTTGGGLYSNGTIYRATTTGGYDTLYSFTGSNDSAAPYAGLTQASDGRLYGTTTGSNGSAGTVFRLDDGLSAPLPLARFLLQTSAKEGDEILVKGDNFVGATGVSFTAAGGALVPADTFAVLSKTVVRAVVPAGAVTGPVTVFNGSLSTTTPTSLTISGTTPPPAVTPTVTVVADRPIASKADSTQGRYKFTRANGDATAALTINYKVRPKSTAVLGADYNLIIKGKAVGLIGTVTIPAGKTSATLKVIPIPSTVAAPAKTVIVKVAPGDGYNLGSPVKATVQVVSSNVGQ